MSRWTGYGPLIVVIVLGLITLASAEYVSKWVAASRTSSSGAIVGRVVRVEGSVRRIHGANIDLISSPLPIPLDLRDGDRLQTSVASKAEVVLNSADEFEVSAGSDLQLVLWNPNDANSPVYIQSRLGTLIFQKPGVHGKAYLVKDGKLYVPGQKPLQKPMALTVLRNAPLDMHLATDGASTTPPGETTPDTTTGENLLPPATANADPETLSNEYIDDTIVSRQDQLQKCWLTHLREGDSAKGQIVMQFEIGKRGKPKDVRVSESSFHDENLQNCVTDVIDRIGFRSFTGAEVSISYPINFE